MESFFQKYFSTDYENVNEEVLLSRRISPYVTLRPGDLAALLHSELPVSLKLGHNHGTSFYSHRKIQTIFEKNQFELSSSGGDDEKNEYNDLVDVVCRGAEQGHVPAEYVVKEIRRHEMPVIGVFVDQRICPGFKYHVRRIGSSSSVWDKARTLESIGMGYGRRLTFTSDHLNSNDCYFWSDSEPNGFAFSIQAVDVGQKFIIQDSFENEVGESIVENIFEPQEEVSMDVGRNGVTKRVKLSCLCNVTYYQHHHHGLKELLCHEVQEVVSGELVLFKSRSCQTASLVRMEKVFLPRLGLCKFIPDI